MTKDEIHSLCEYYNVGNYSINDDMSVNANGVVYFNSYSFDEIPIKFNEINGSFLCIECDLKSLKNAPNILSGLGTFECAGNKLETLIGTPKEVTTFDCSHNKLKTLEGSPEKVDQIYTASHNRNLTSFKGAPEKVKIFVATNCNIKSFEYCPDFKHIFLDDNPLDEIWQLFQNADYIEYFNELDIIQENGNVIILDRLNYFLTDIGKQEIDENDIENYIVE